MYLYSRSVKVNGDNALYFNIEYLSKGSQTGTRDVTNRRDNTTNRDLAQIDFRDSTDAEDRGVFNVDTLQVKLIPCEWGLSAETKPEIWWFSMANDNVVIRAQRSDTYSLLLPGPLGDLQRNAMQSLGIPATKREWGSIAEGNM